MTPAIITSETADAPGLYRMTERAYHADPCPTPSLSRSIAVKLIDQSPLHAWTAHPRLNPNFDHDDEESRKADIGSAAHALLLRQPIQIIEIDAPTYQSKAAKQARADAYLSGAIPLLTPDHERVAGLIEAARMQLAAHELEVIRAVADPSAAPAPYHNEIVAVWQDSMNGHWCRVRLDRLVLSERRVTIVDYKTTEMSASPHAVGNAIFNNAYHLQDGFYRRGVRHLFPGIDRHEVAFDFLFIVQEQKPPFALTVARIMPAGRVIGEKMASAAIRMWDRCMSTGEWPGYPLGTAEVDIPPYHETRWCAREIEDPIFEQLRDDPFPHYEARPYQPTKLVEPI